MKTCNTVIAELLHAKGHADQERRARAHIREEHLEAKAAFEHSEAQIHSLESTYQNAREVLQNLEQEAKRIEQETQTALAASQDDKAHSFATEISKLHASVVANRADVNRLESTILTLKGTLSQNRFHLFRLEQQMDTLSATTQLQQAQNKLASQHGVRTALTAFNRWAQQSASNDAPGQTAVVSATANEEQTVSESPEAILTRLRANTPKPQA